MTIIIKVENEMELIGELSSRIEKISKESVDARGVFTIGLSGGSLIQYLCKGLPNINTDWSKWVLGFCDERVVPETSEDSTFGAYKRKLLAEVPLKESQFITIEQGVDARTAAEDYDKKLMQIFKSDDYQFDALLLGMGPDGHTCSLFPEHPLLEENSLNVAYITDSPKPPPERITLTYKVINGARNCIFAVSGEGKADVVKRILDLKEDLPASRVKPSGNLYWILDEAAAKYL